MANEFKVKNGLIVIGDLTTSGTITINGALAATQSWVTSQSYLTSANLSGYATQSYVTSAIASLVDSAPAALDTLKELATALGNDASFATTVTNSIAGKVAKSGDTMTGSLTFANNADDIRINKNNNWLNLYDPWNNIHLRNGNSGYGVYIDSTIHYWRPHDGSVTWMTLSSTGLGIGVNSPNYKLDVGGTIALRNTSYYSGTYDWSFSQNSSNGRLAIAYYGSEKVSVLDNGNVGIGTTSPARKLVVNGETWINLTSDYFGGGTTVQISSGGTGAVGIQSNTFYLYPYSSDTATNLVYGYNGNASWNLNNGGNNRFNFFSYGGGITVMSLTSGGNVGIGTTSPGYKLDVSGTGRFTGVLTVETDILTRSKLQISNGRLFELIGTSTALNIYDASAGASRIYITDSGNVGIGTTNPDYKLDVSGTARFTQSISLNQSAVIKKRFDSGTNNSVKTASGVLASRSDNGGGSTYYVIETNVPQDDYQMGGFTIELFGNYSSTNHKTKIDLGGYWNAEGNGGFIGFEAHGSNPQYKPTIEVARNTSTGNTAFIIYGLSWNYPVIVARDLWLGYTVTDGGAYGEGWSIVGTETISGYSNRDTVVWRNAYSDSNPAGYITGYTETDTLQSVTSRGATTNTLVSLNSGLRMGNAYLTPSGDQNHFHFDGTAIIPNSSTTANNASMGTNTYRWSSVYGGYGYFSENVGIGTTSPAQKLSVAGNIETVSGTGIKIGFNVADAFTAYGNSVAHYGISYNYGSSPLALSGYFGLGLFTNGTERLSITNPGNVGIGTTAPSKKLHIYESGAKDAELLITSTYADGYDAQITLENTHTGGRKYELLSTNDSRGTIGGGKFAINDKTAGDSVARLVIDSSGNVGIGTNSPNQTLEVRGADNSTVQAIFQATDGQAAYRGGIQLGNASGNQNSQIYHNSSGDNTLTFVSNYSSGTGNKFVFAPGGTETVRFQQNGNVGIGTTSPGAKLHVVGNTYIQSGILFVDTIAAYSTNLISIGASTNILVPSGDITIGSGASTSTTQPFGDFSQLKFDNLHSDTNRGPNKIVMHDNGGSWIGGFGIHSDTVSYYTGGHHRWYKTDSQTSSSQVMQLDPSGNLTLAGTLSASGYNKSNWDTAYSWGNHASAGYQPAATAINTSNIGSQSVSYANSAGSASTAATATDGLRLLREDNRTISPSELAAGYLKFGFTSWTNDNSGPYADFLHLRSYTDYTGGDDNLVMFKKSGIGMRIYQQTFGSATAYSSYADVWTTVNFTQSNVNNWNTAYGWGNHASAGYLTSVTAHTQAWSTITSTPTTISGYGITNAYTDAQIQNFFSGANSISGYNKSNWDTAYSWGNHASASYATTSYVTTQINNLINGAPGVLDTLDELAAALGDDANFATTVTNSIAGKVSKGGDTITTNNQYGLVIDHSPVLGDFVDALLVRSTTSAQRAQIGFATVDADGDHHRASIRAYKGAGTLEGVFGIALRQAGSGAHVQRLTLDYLGNLTIGGALTESSSFKLKENIETSEGNLEKVVNLRPVTYNKIGSQTTELGLIAEEVAEVYPEFVQYDENGEPVGVHYSRLTAALIGAVKELTNQVQELNKKING